MATNTLNTRIILKNDTAANWAASTLIPLAGELCIEKDSRKCKLGDGVNTYKDLKYITLTPEEINTIIAGLNDSKHSHSNKAILDATTASFTEALLNKLNGISAGAQVNQNAFSKVVVGNTTVEADTATDTLTLAGSNVTITPDVTNDKITIGVANGSTSEKGLVQLTDGVASTSTSTAATPAAVKKAYDLADTANKAAAAAQKTADSKVGSVSLASGTNNGTVKLTVDGTATDNIAVKGLRSAAYTDSSAYATATQGKKADNAMPKSGGTFTGDVTLNADPTANLGAATKQYVDSQITSKIAASDAMVFKGTLGTNGTITEVPTTNVVKGDTYKIITAGTYAGSACKVGDLIIALTSGSPKATADNWAYVPSGNENETTISYSTTTQNLTTSAKTGSIILGEAATKQIDSSIASGSTSTKLPTSKAVAVLVDDQITTVNKTISDHVGNSNVHITADERTKLSGIAAGAEVNQNAFSKVTIGSTTVSAGTKTDTLNVVAGSNVTITPDATDKKITISAKDTTYTANTGIKVDGTVIKHTNSVTAGTAQGDASKTLAFGGTFTVPTVSYDAQGHITGKGTTTMTMPATPSTITGNAGSATKLQTARTIDGVSFNGTADITHYGTCNTEAATAAKVVSLTGFTLATGAKAMVKFTVTNTAASPTLNINNTGAKAIMYRGAIISTGVLAAKRIYEFVYDGTNYELVGDINTDTNTDTKVTNTLNTTTKAYVTGTTNATTNTGTQIFDTGVYLDTTAGTLVASTFKGNLSGNASTASKATKADQLTTARNISLSGGVNGTAQAFDGTKNISIPVSSVNTDYLVNGDNVLILDCGTASANVSTLVSNDDGNVVVNSTRESAVNDADGTTSILGENISVMDDGRGNVVLHM